MHIGKIHFYNNSRQTLQIKCHCSKTSFSISQRVLEGSVISVTHTSFDFSRDEFAAVTTSAGYRKKDLLLTFDLQNHPALASHTVTC